MSARFEVVHTGPYKFHARFVAANNEIVWTTESYKTKRAAREAIGLIADGIRLHDADLPPSGLKFREVDERREKP